MSDDTFVIANTFFAIVSPIQATFGLGSKVSEVLLLSQEIRCPEDLQNHRPQALCVSCEEGRLLHQLQMEAGALLRQYSRCG